MRIAVAQVASLRADIAGNLAHHEGAIALAAAQEVRLLVFPELSLSQYDPPTADDVATTPDDVRFQRLQALADAHAMTICSGIPLRSEAGIVIAMLIHQPGQDVQLYTKRYLHEDELPCFVPGYGGTLMKSPHGDIAFAICYELSVPAHAQAAHAGGAKVYIASVAKTQTGVLKAHNRLAEIARTYEMTVLMANCAGECERKPAGGKSALWDAQGQMLACLGEREEALLICDLGLPGSAPQVVRLTPSAASS
jgi:predicted amidohydrolase